MLCELDFWRHLVGRITSSRKGNSGRGSGDVAELINSEAREQDVRHMNRSLVVGEWT